MELDSKQSSLPKSITILGFIANLLLAIGKGLVGYIAQSSALIADAGHSLSDLFSDLITYWSLHFSQQPRDENHPYGHGRFETVGSFIIALMLIATGIGVVWHTFQRIESPVIPGELALWAAGISIVIKELLYQLTHRIGKKQNSRILIANAWHHRSDAVSSIAALIGITGATLGFPMLDPIAGFLVAGLIIKSGVDIGYSSIRELTDEVAEQEVIEKILQTLEGIEGVEHFHQVRARRMGPHLLVDLHLEVDCMMTVSAAHQVAERVRWHILETMPSVNEVMIHVDAEQDNEEGEIILMRPQTEIERPKNWDKKLNCFLKKSRTYNLQTSILNFRITNSILFLNKPLKSSKIKATMNQSSKTEIEAAVFRKLLSHLDSRKDVQNIDLMNLAGFCRNCLAKWYSAEAEERGEEVSVDSAKELVYGMTYKEWKDNFQI